MSWLSVISNLASRVPVERVFFPPRDKAKALEEFAATITAPVAENKAPPGQRAAPTITQVPRTVPPQEDIATACVPCALGHFSTSAGLLNEAVRFKKDGMTSNEIIDRVGKVLQEQNTLEREDLTPENIRILPKWERDIAEEALQQSRSLRHRLETIETIDDIEQAAADTSTYFRRLNREWWKGRFAHLGPAKAQIIAERVGKLSPEDKDRVLRSPEELDNMAKCPQCGGPLDKHGCCERCGICVLKGAK